ncbi:MAG: glycosyl transferase family 2, partial [bacterium]
FSVISHTLETKDSAGAFSLSIDTSSWWLKFIAFITTLRSRLTKIPYGDQAIFIHKDYFLALGGYKNIPLMEDIELMKAIKKNNGKISILPDYAITSSRRWDKHGHVKTTVINRIIRILYSFGINPHILEKKYYKN